MWRLETVYALRTAVFILAVSFLVRVIIAGTLWLTNDEAVFWALSHEWQWHYAGQPPLAFWLSRISTEIFGDHLLALRLPSLIALGIASLGLVKLVVKMGWAKGADATAVLFIATPLLFLDGVLAGPTMLFAAAWILMMNFSFQHGKRALLFTATSVIAVLLHPATIFGVVAGLSRFSRARTVLLASIAVTAAAFAMWRQPHSIDYVLAAALCGPGIFGGLWFLARENRRLGFLKTWMLAGLAALAFDPNISLVACIPVLIYFAKLSASLLRPQLVRFSIMAGLALTFVGTAVLYEQDAGWRRLDTHLANLPPQAQSWPLVVEDNVLGAQAQFAGLDKTLILSRQQSTLPENYLLLSHKDSKQILSVNNECESYSMLKKLRLSYCRHLTNAQRAIAAEPNSSQ